MSENIFNDKHVIRSRSFYEVFTYIDAAYAAHGNMIGHMGGYMSISYGIIYRKGTKQKIDVNSLTEAELVIVSEYILYNL